MEGVTALKAKGYRLVVVTSRQLVIKDATHDWLERNFPDGIFDEVVFGNHWGKNGVKTSKLDLCKELNASVLIDDSLIYATEVAKEGIPALLFSLDNSYPWNQADELPRGVTRVTDWNAVVDQVVKLIDN